MGNKFVYPHRRQVYLAEWIRVTVRTNTALAKKLKVNKSTVSVWIDEQERISLDILSACADAMGLRDVGLLFHHPDTVPDYESIRTAATELLKRLRDS